MSRPIIYNVFKPTRCTSYDVIRHFKYHLPKGYGKIGHFGTLDPFACGVLLIATGQATRLNNYIHEFPKTYLAVGKLGVETPTGDLTVEPTQADNGPFFKEVFPTWSSQFIEERLQEKFLGEYWQAPPAYSAAKFEGRALHEWAREGVTIKKAEKKRVVYSLKVVKYAFPYLTLRVEVSSGTYIRTLFSDCARHLGTLGTLVSLQREKVGPHHVKDALKKNEWPERGAGWDESTKGLTPDQAFPLSECRLEEKDMKLFLNGGAVSYATDSATRWFWVYSAQSDQLLGLGELREGKKISPVLNFSHSLQGL